MVKYCSWADYLVKFDGDAASFLITYNGKVILKNAKLDGIDKFDGVIVDVTTDYNALILTKGEDEYFIKASFGGVNISRGDGREISLFSDTDADESFYAMSGEKKKSVFNAAYGPASNKKCNMLFDRESDSATVAKSDEASFYYDWNKKSFCLTARGSDINISIEKRIYENNYHIDYAPINKNTTFKRPPVGWMTWYAVKFDAGEKTVLENARLQAEKFKDYGANTIWVDWEWYHKDMSGTRDDGFDTFNPDREKYPHGLKYISEEIKKLGFIPSLWIGYTNDPGENEYIKENPDIVLKRSAEWCGQYHFDFSNPKYLNEFLPKALSQVYEWGYEAVKYDTLPKCIEMHEKYHENMTDPSLTTKQVFRNMVKKTREELGRDCYMLSCCRICNSDFLWAIDMFDAGRIGGDIFKWSEFIEEGIKNAARYYPLHNVVLLCDPDNVVLRDEFSTYDEAKSRISFVSLLGMPINFGDELSALSEEKTELIRRSIPPIDVHPMNINPSELEDVVVTNLSVCREFESYNVFGVFNTSEEKMRYTLDLDFHNMDKKEYVAFDFYAKEKAPVTDMKLTLDLKAHETKVISVREKLSHPQIISTSRHITQGAYEIESVIWDEAKASLSMTAQLVKNDKYEVYILMPEGYELKESNFDVVRRDKNMLVLGTVSDENRTAEMNVSFVKNE